MMMRKVICCLMLSSVLFSCATEKGIRKGNENNLDPGAALIQFYRGPLNRLAAVRRGECPMHPSCSEYSRQCFQKHGFLLGWTMTCDRLMRCGRDEMKLAPNILIRGKWKYYDPVEKNDSWWDNRDASELNPMNTRSPD